MSGVLCPKCGEIVNGAGICPNEERHKNSFFARVGSVVDSGPKTLDAKWLDPECWDGCQSLLLKAKIEQYEKLLRSVLEWCETDTPNFEIDTDAIRNAINPQNKL